MDHEILIGVDIGASSIRAGAFDPGGTRLAFATRPNAPVPQRGSPGWYVWDAVALRSALEDVIGEVTAALQTPAAIRSIAVTGFGADGAPFSAAGVQQYPIISWHDARAKPQLLRLVDQLGAEAIYATTGYHPYPINTLGRWLWLREHEPDVLDAATWLMVPHIAAYWLGGEMRTDPTSASTTMAFDLNWDKWAIDLLEAAEISPELPAPRAEPGEAIGTIGASIAGLPAGTVVAVGGHDCEVGTLAATAVLPADTFIDITGTWEMLIMLSSAFEPSDELFAHGIDWERHAAPGVYLCQSLMPAGSVLAWLRDLAYRSGIDGWREMVQDAERTEPGAEGVTVVPAFVPDMGPLGATDDGGALRGLTTTTTRGQLARAVFESLCYQLRAQLQVLEGAAQRPCAGLRVLGGGQRNDFWLQLKADVTGLPVEAVETDELTLLGAALLGGVGAGVYSSLEEAQRTVHHDLRVFEPNPERHARYRELYERDFARTEV